MQEEYNPRQKLSTIKNNSFTSRAAALFNAIPNSVKNTDSLEVFKKRLDSYLKMIPDYPPVHGYPSSKNSLLDWANCRWDKKQDVMRMYSSATDACLNKPSVAGEELTLPDRM